MPSTPSIDPSPTHPPAITDLPDLASLWRWDDPAASERAFRAAVVQAQAAGAGDYEAEAWTQVARSEGLQKHFDEAQATLDGCAPLLRDVAPAPRIRWNLEQGRVLRSSGLPEDSKPFFLAAWELANQAGEIPLALDAAHMLALVEPPDEALAWAERAIAIAEGSSDPRARSWLGPLYNNTGWAWFERAEYERALDLWRKGVAVRTDLGQTGEPLRIAWWTVARGLRALGRHAEAIAILERLDRECASTGAPDGYVYEEMAENLLALDRPDDARPQFLRAYTLLKDAEDVMTDPARLERLRGAAGIAGG
jgi:tetratricopeptide (TPR) repeat protein